MSFYTSISIAPLLVIAIAIAGSLAVFLLWVYYMSQVYAQRHRARLGKEPIFAEDTTPSSDAGDGSALPT